MEQSNNMKPRGNGGPKMPRFNMTWLFTICLITMIILFFTGGGDAIGGSAAKEATYTQFKQYVDKGYVLSVVANKTESTLKIYINPKYTRDVYNMPAKSVGPNPYVKVQFGSVDEVERYANQMLKEKKIRSFSYDNQKDNDFLSTLFNLAPLLFFVFFILWMSGRFSGGMGSGGMGGGMNMNMIKQAQKMQQDMLKMQEELENKTYEASVGGGVVKAVVNGKHEVLSLTISPDAVEPDDVEMLQDMVVGAVNEAMRKAESEASANMSRLTGGLNLGGLF